MTDALQFVLLGLGSGAIYALAAQGIVVIYRGSGVLNFSQGALGLLSASIFVYTWNEEGWPLLPAMIVAVVAAALTGALVYLLVMRPLRASSPLVRLVASLGVLTVLQQSVIMVFGSDVKLVPSFLPEGRLEIIDGASIGNDRITILATAVVLTIGLAAYFRFTRLGMATQATNDDPIAASALGWSPIVIGCVNWTIGAALGGLAGVFIVPIAGLSPVALTLVILPGFAAALASGFRSFSLALTFGLLLGVGQALLVRYGTDIFSQIPGLHPDGWSDALPFLLIVVVLVWRGSVIPSRGELGSLLPRVGMPGRLGLGHVLAIAALAGFVAIGPEDLVASVVTSLLVAIVGLSVVLLTGYAGQLSLGQMAIAGVAALVAGRLSGSEGLPFIAATAIAIVAAVGVGALFALPSLRSRGVSLAVVTLGLGIAVEKVVFANSEYTGGLNGTDVKPPTLFGWNFSSVAHPARYGLVVVAAFALAALVVSNIRRGMIGRRFLAVRSNEHAAASLGISIPAVKIVAFGLAAAVAALGGVLVAFRFSVVQYGTFDLFASLQVVILTVIGGTGYVLGAAIGSVLAPGGLVEFLTEGITDAQRWVLLLSGVGLLVTLIAYPDGLADLVTRAFGRRKWRAPRSVTTPTAPSAKREGAVAAVALTVEGLSVAFGGVQVLDDVSLSVTPGRITGLIGANGAGKTTLLEAVSGFVRPSAGTVKIGDGIVTGRSATRLARAGIRRSFQGVESFDDLTVRENLLVAAEELGWSGWFREVLRPTAPRIPDRLAALADEFGLTDELDRSPNELPFGRRRLLGVARALAGRPAVLLLDEPASGLNNHETGELASLLRRVVDTQGIGVLLVEHDVDMVVDLCDDVVVLDVGRVIFHGAAADLLADPLVISAYLGDNRKPLGESTRREREGQTVAADD